MYTLAAFNRKTEDKILPQTCAQKKSLKREKQNSAHCITVMDLSLEGKLLVPEQKALFQTEKPLKGVLLSSDWTHP